MHICSKPRLYEAIYISHTRVLYTPALQGAIKYILFLLNPSFPLVLAYRKAIEFKPNYVRAWVNMGISYANQNKDHIAVRYYARALTYVNRRSA